MTAWSRRHLICTGCVRGGPGCRFWTVLPVRRERTLPGGVPRRDLTLGHVPWRYVSRRYVPRWLGGAAAVGPRAVARLALGRLRTRRFRPLGPWQLLGKLLRPRQLLRELLRPGELLGELFRPWQLLGELLGARRLGLPARCRGPPWWLRWLWWLRRLHGLDIPSGALRSALRRLCSPGDLRNRQVGAGMPPDQVRNADAARVLH